jgi:hypothetical protein
MMILNPYIINQGDADVAAFLSATGITDSTIISAIETLVLSLKSNNLWTKLDLIYPFVGGTATTHKFNLKDPRDLDAAYRLTFYGGWTHSSTGVLPNGSNGYADTNYNPYTVYGSAVTEPSHFSFYSRTNSSGLKAILGQYESSGFYVQIMPSTTFYYDYPDGRRATASNANSTGYYVAYNNSTNGKDMWRNNVQLFNVAYNNGRYTNANLLLSQWGNSSRYSNHELAFVTFGGAHIWDSTMASNLYTIVNTFQTSLSRNV